MTTKSLIADWWKGVPLQSRRKYLGRHLVHGSVTAFERLSLPAMTMVILLYAEAAIR